MQCTRQIFPSLQHLQHKGTSQPNLSAEGCILCLARSYESHYRLSSMALEPTFCHLQRVSEHHNLICLRRHACGRGYCINCSMRNTCCHGLQVRAKAVELGELEERYWHDFNDFQIQLRAHVDERDVLLRKVRGERSSAKHAFAMLCGPIRIDTWNIDTAPVALPLWACPVRQAVLVCAPVILTGWYRLPHLSRLACAGKCL